MGLLEGFTVSGEYVSNLKDKSAVIIKVPSYVEMRDLDDKTKQIRKVLLFIELSDGTQMDYYPNKTSQKDLGNAWGIKLDDWLGRKFEFEITDQKVRGETKKVLYAKPIKTEKKK